MNTDTTNIGSSIEGMAAVSIPPKSILWWGRFAPEYSRNRILRSLLEISGFRIFDFRPQISLLGSLQARFAKLEVPDAVWVPAFRQTDFASARHYADKHHIPLIFDPLISAWDKKVFERKKYSESDIRARRLLNWERSLFSRADLVIADTELHAQFFVEKLGVERHKVSVIPVGAEEQLFTEQPFKPIADRPEILFYGSFIHLQGPEVIIEAARQVPQARWTMLGEGPLKEICQKKGDAHAHIHFEDWIPYETLPERIGKADILLGIFGSSQKPGRVIPNKAYQSLACGRPLITRQSAAYPTDLQQHSESGLVFIPPGDPDALAAAAKNLVSQPEQLPAMGKSARLSYDRFFSEKSIHTNLLDSFAKLQLLPSFN